MRERDRQRHRENISDGGNNTRKKINERQGRKHEYQMGIVFSSQNIRFQNDSIIHPVCLDII